MEVIENKVADIEDIEEIEDNFYENLKNVKAEEGITGGGSFTFDPTMLDYTFDNGSSLRLEYIKSIKDTDTKIKEMEKLIKESIKYPFPEEFYPFLAREALGIKFKKHELVAIRRENKIKYKRAKKKEYDLKKKHNKKVKNNKHPNKFLKRIEAPKNNPFVLTF
jgi:hypothetical protein